MSEEDKRSHLLPSGISQCWNYFRRSLSGSKLSNVSITACCDPFVYLHNFIWSLTYPDFTQSRLNSINSCSHLPWEVVDFKGWWWWTTTFLLFTYKCSWWLWIRPRTRYAALVSANAGGSGCLRLIAAGSGGEETRCCQSHGDGLLRCLVDQWSFWKSKCESQHNWRKKKVVLVKYGPIVKSIYMPVSPHLKVKCGLSFSLLFHLIISFTMCHHSTLNPAAFRLVFPHVSDMRSFISSSIFRMQVYCLIF